jgi:hypothetical protein
VGGSSKEITIGIEEQLHGLSPKSKIGDIALQATKRGEREDGAHDRSFVKKAQQQRCFKGKNTPSNTIDVAECYAKVMQWLACTDNMENRIGSWPIPMEKESAILRALGRPTKTKPKHFSMRQQKRSGYGKRVTSLNSALAQL